MKLDSPPALALQQQIDRTKARFDKYGRSALIMWNRWITTFNC